MMKRDFYRLVACINREAAIWLHEGVMRGASADMPLSDDARSRFCASIRGLLNDIEMSGGLKPPAIASDLPSTAAELKEI